MLCWPRPAAALLLLLRALQEAPQGPAPGLLEAVLLMARH
jgi:hypothetical protein